jgi:hypothetical protein
MKYIVLFSRPDRLGSNITMYISQLLFAQHHSYYIQYDRKTLAYGDSCFVNYLCECIDVHNSQFTESPSEKVNFIQGDWSRQIGDLTRLIQSDHIHQFKRFYKTPTFSGYTVPFDPRKTIAVHLRLDDVAHIPECDGSLSANYYRDVMNSEKVINHVHSTELPNHQSPLSTATIMKRIDLVKQSYPDYEVVVIASPRTKISDLPYRVIQSSDQNYDLFLLSVCDVVILSRSTFALSSLFFGNHKEVHVPLIGFFVVFGLSTKYDQSHFIYF